jgi:hypothetical protein
VLCCAVLRCAVPPLQTAHASIGMKQLLTATQQRLSALVRLVQLFFHSSHPRVPMPMSHACLRARL